MKNHSRYAFAISTLFLVVALADCGEPELRRRFLTEAPIAWEKYRAFTATLQGTCEALFIHNGEKYSHTRHQVVSNSRCRSVRIDDLVHKDVIVMAYNDDYSFHVRRPGAKNGWRFEQLALKTTNAAEFERKSGEVRSIDYSGASALIQAHGEHLATLIKQETFRVVRASDVDRDNEKMVEIIFTNSHPITDRPFVAIQSGTIILDPNRSWCLRAGETTCKYANGDMKTTIETEIHPGTGEFPVPKRYVTRSQSTSGDQKTQVHTIEYDLQKPSTMPPDGEFYASVFGLPEPISVKPPPAPTRWWLWLSLAALALFGIVGLYFKLRQRYFTEPAELTTGTRKQ